MLTIRRKQMRVLTKPFSDSFRKKAIEHIREHFPSQSENLEDEELDGLIKHGKLRAAFHGIKSERGVSKYLNLMFTFGKDFDLEQDWAVRILDRYRKQGGGDPIEQLYATGLVNENTALGVYPDSNWEKP